MLNYAVNLLTNCTVIKLALFFLNLLDFNSCLKKFGLSKELLNAVQILSAFRFLPH